MLGVHGGGSVHGLSVGAKRAPQLGTARDGVATVQMLTHHHRDADTRPTTWLRCNLQDLTIQTHGVVAGHHTRLFMTQNDVEIGRAQRDKGTRRIARGARERGVVVRHNVIGQGAVGGPRAW